MSTFKSCTGCGGSVSKGDVCIYCGNTLLSPAPEKKKFKGDMQTFKTSDSIIKGDMNEIAGDRNTIIGDMNKIKGNDNRIKGDMNTVRGTGSLFSGDMNKEKS